MISKRVLIFLSALAAGLAAGIVSAAGAGERATGGEAPAIVVSV